MTPRVSVVVPVRDEGAQIVTCLDRLLDAVRLPSEVLVVYDSPDDTTAPHVEEYAKRDHRVAGVLNTDGPGPARAIRFGIAAARAPVVVVTMADGSDDVRQIDDLARLVEDGAAVAAASRYAPGGRRRGGPALKGVLSRVAGLTLHWFARLGTRDATNSFKAYSKRFVDAVGIDSRSGFEVGIELAAKARRLGLKVVEIPTVWTDREAGESKFKLVRWLPRYLRWYAFAFGPRLTPEQLACKRGAR